MSGKKNSTVAHCVRRYDWIRRQLRDGNSLNCREIADRLDISTKTAQRYINTLRLEGHDITYDPTLRGFVISSTSERALPPERRRLNVIRMAVQWARQNHISAPWVEEAKKLLTKS